MMRRKHVDRRRQGVVSVSSVALSLSCKNSDGRDAPFLTLINLTP